jgi:hypothetical protein
MEATLRGGPFAFSIEKDGNDRSIKILPPPEGGAEALCFTQHIK